MKSKSIHLSRFAFGLIMGMVAVCSISATWVSTKIWEDQTSVNIGRTGDSLSFLGATAVAQPSGAAQAAVTLTAATNSTATATDLTTSEALANACKTQGNALQVDVAALKAQVDSYRTALVNLGLIKGGS